MKELYQNLNSDDNSEKALNENEVKTELKK